MLAGHANRSTWMTEVEEVKRLLDRMNEQQRRTILGYLRSLLPAHRVEERLMISSEGILDALDRAGDFTFRMIRGVFAEAAFATDVLPTISERWRLLPIVGDRPFDFWLTDIPVDVTPAESLPFAAVRLQVKMQRSVGKRPLHANEVWRTRVAWPADHYVVELQKSRKGQKRGVSTRPYHFDEFDLVAVSLGPARGRWGAFIYTVARWLLPDPANPANVLLYQPVAPHDNDCWTTDFNRAVEWLRGGLDRRINGAVPRLVGKKSPRKKRSSKKRK
jgi:hypothetical protein